MLASVHAFSVLLDSLTQRLEASTASVSAIYSLAVVSITATVTPVHPLFGKMNARFEPLLTLPKGVFTPRLALRSNQ